MLLLFLRQDFSVQLGWPRICCVVQAGSGVTEGCSMPVTWAYNPVEHLDLYLGLLCEYLVILIYLWFFVSEHTFLLKFIFNPNSQLLFFKLFPDMCRVSSKI